MHLNPRLRDGHTVLNAKRGGQWGDEERQPLSVVQEDGSVFQAFTPGQQVQVVVKGVHGHQQVYVNGQPYARFANRIKPEEITHFK